MSDSIVTLDVREDLRQGREPFARIIQMVNSLEEDQGLLLIAPFKPAPLFEVMAQRGFQHEARLMPGGDWEVLFSRSTKPVSSNGNAPFFKSPRTEHKIVRIDARGLEPPQPLVVILEAVAALPPGSEIHAQTDRKPLHLYDELLRRGFSGQTEEMGTEGFLTFIRPK